MEELVSRYIEEELLSLNAVELPWVGLLYIERQSASIDYEVGLITPPYDTLELSNEEVYIENFLDNFSLFLQKNTTVGNYLSPEQFYERARVEYENWWQENRTQTGELFIDGVCTINTDERRITSMDESLQSMLLPYSEALAIPNDLSMDSRELIIVPRPTATATTQPPTKTRHPRVAHISTIGLVLSIIAFVCSLLYIGYIVLNATIL